MNVPLSNTPSARHIRLLRHDDIELLQAIDRVAHGTEWSQRTFLDDIDREDRCHLVLECQDTIVGHAAAWVDDASCRITNVAVAPEHTGQGHASALMVALLGHALTTSRVSNMQLEVRPANRRAQRLYSRFGFVPVGIERSFYDRGDALGNRDAVVMAVADVCADSWRDRFKELVLQTNAEVAA